MANALLTSIAPENDPEHPYPYDELQRLRRSARLDRFGKHDTTSNPVKADVIIYVESGYYNPIQHYFEVREDEYYRHFQEKCFLFSRYDYPVPILPGVYASIPKRWYHPQRTRTGPHMLVQDQDFVQDGPVREEKKHLYSFVGNRTSHPLREKLFELNHPEQKLRDTSQHSPYGDLDPDVKQELERRYVMTCLRSKFVLCPRGSGVSSIRLFECLRMGCAPVIIADQWVPPQGPDWEGFSVRVAENDVSLIPMMLSKRASQADQMGRRARNAWENWFSKEAVFHRVVQWCLGVQRARTMPERLLRLSVLPQFTQTKYFKALVRHALSGETYSKLVSLWRTL